MNWYVSFDLNLPISPIPIFQLFDNLGTWPLDFKKIAWQVLMKYWNFDAEDETEVVQVTALYNELMKNVAYIHGDCQDQFSSTILLGGPGVQGTNEEVSPDTSRC